MSGGFLFIDLSRAKANAKAKLISPSNQKTAGSCVQFYFYTLNNKDHTLNVYLRDGQQQDMSAPVWTVTGDAGDEYMMREFIYMSFFLFKMR